MNPLFFTTLIMLIHASCYGQLTHDKQLEQQLTELLSKRFNRHEPGVSVLIARKGTIVYEKAFGSANLELDVPVQPAMVFNLGSITKQFTAVAILQLVEKGLVSLQDSIQQYIKDYPWKGYTITIEHLLTHTSGIKDYMRLNYAEPYMERRDFSPGQLIDSFKNRALDFEPGTRFLYSNSGYFLLGYIIEKVTGKSYARYIQDNIFTPLALTGTYYDSTNAVYPNRVSGYKKEVGYYEKADYWSTTIAYAAGGMISNVEDIYKWHKGLYAYKILKKETLAKAFTPFALKDGMNSGYGYGWFLKSTNGIRSVEHGGAITGFHSNEIYYPDDDVFIALLFNCDCAPSDELSVRISALALGKPLQQEVKVDETVLNSYTGTYSLRSDPGRTIVISKEKGYLAARVSGQAAFQLVFQSGTRFQLKGVIGASCEFIRENNQVTKMIVSQDGIFEWIKIK